MRSLANLASVMIRPRQTMRRILDAPRDRMVIPLVILAIFSAYAGDFNVEEYRRLRALASVDVIVMAAAGILVIVPAIAIGIFFLFSWLAAFVGRMLEGTGGARALRSAMAWGMAPLIWALLYRIPAAMWAASAAHELRMEDFRFTLQGPKSGCAIVLAFLLLELIAIVWSIVVMSHTVAEAHRFSAARGFGTLAICFTAPIVIGIAAALSFAF